MSGARIESPPAAATAPDPSFAVEGAESLAHAAVPTLRFRVGIDAGELAVRSVLLDVQIQIAARRRPYGPEAQERLGDLFGSPERWSSTLRTLPWTRLTAVVPPFSGRTAVHLDVTCTYDLEVAAANYFAALDDGAIPLEFLFAGSVFYAGAGGQLQATRISLDKEAGYELPLATWREAIDAHFPEAAWLRLDRRSFERLQRYRARNSLPSWEAALDSLLREREP